MTVDEAKRLEEKVDALIRLTALGLLGDRTGSDAITLLDRAGLDTDVIAGIVGTTAATVRSARSRTARKKGGRDA
jgi:hypothetical protein